jgi:hypothetical protein
VAQFVIPLLAALLALAWPVWQQFQRRWTFTRLVRAELLEAAPQPGQRDGRMQWTSHLSRGFVHAQLIGDPTGNTEFVLSLDPRLSCSLSQMWINFAAAKKQLENGPSDEATSAELAQRWCGYLDAACQYLDRRGRTKRLTAEVWRPWHNLLAEYYPQEPDGNGGHRHLPSTLDESSSTAQQGRR